MNLAIRVIPFSSSIRVSGTIQDFTPGEVSLLLDMWLPVGIAVTVAVKDARFDGEVLYCEQKESQYQTNVRFRDSAENGLRRTPRFTVKLAAKVFSEKSGDPSPATITNISGDGLGLQVPHPLSSGEPIIIESEMNVAFGVVRYCRERSEDLFDAGIQLHHVIEKENNPVKANAARGTFAKAMSLIGLKPRNKGAAEAS